MKIATVQSQAATNVSPEAQSLIDDLTKKADEMKNQRDMAISAESELRDQVSNLQDMIKDLEITEEQNTETQSTQKRRNNNRFAHQKAKHNNSPGW